MKKFRNIPTIITLLAGFVTCVIMILCEYSITSFLWILVTVMTVFFVAGTIIRILLSKVLKEKDESEEKGASKDGEEADADGQNDKDVSVKAKDDGNT